MRIVVDALAATDGSHLIVTQGILQGWPSLGADDEIHLVLSDDTAMDVPPSVVVHRLPLRRPRTLSRIGTQFVALRRICREIKADVLFASAPASAMRSVGAPRCVLVYDLRHELRPDQFSRVQRLQRAVSWGYNFRVASSFVCISGRTRDDLRRRHPRLARLPAFVAHLGADQVAGWATPSTPPAPYALAFGHFGNKNVDKVIAAWGELAGRGPVPELRVTGLSDENRVRVRQLAEAAGVADRVVALPWASATDFEARFTGADMIVFPSDFEGFGLPVVEGMFLGKRVVISTDPALLEISDGHAVIARTVEPRDLADAIEQAWRLTDEHLAAAQRFAQRYTWSATAAVVRQALESAVTAGGR